MRREKEAASPARASCHSERADKCMSGEESRSCDGAQDDRVGATDLEVALEAIQRTLHRGQPPTLPESLTQHEGLQALLVEIAALQDFVLALGKGDLDQTLPLHGMMAGGLKSLQAHLRHLTWQTQQIAKGDFSQHVDFMGEFSEAFNAMVDGLRESQATLKRRERELREVNANLRREEERFRLAFEEAGAGMCLVSPDGYFMRVNQRLCEIFGYDRQTLEGLHVNEITHPDYLDVSPTYIDHATSGGPPRAEFEKLYFHKQGHLVWGRVTSALVRDAEGKPRYFISHVQDITRQKQAEAELRKSEQRFATVMNSMEATMYVADMETYELLFVNQYTRDIFGDVEGQICWKVLQKGKTAPCDFCTNAYLLDEQGEPTGVYTWEFQNTLTRRWYHIQDQAIRWTDGRWVRLEIATDITDLKRAEDRIRESEARYRLLAENMADVIWVLDTASMTFSYVSPSVEALRGYTPEEVLQQPMDQVMTPASLAHVEADLPGRIQRFLNGDPGAVTQIDEIEQGRKDGSTVWTEVSTTLILTPEGTIDVVGVSRDITERRRIEQQIKRTNADLQRRVRELSALNRITQAMATQTHLGEALHLAIRETVLLFDALTGAVGLLDEERQGQTLVAIYNSQAQGFEGPPTDAVYIPLDGDAPARHVIETGEPLIIANMFEHPENEINRTLARQYRIKSNMTTPLWARGEIIGTFSVARHESMPAFTDHEVELAQTIAGQIAGAIANAKYLDELRQARDVAERARSEAEAASQAKSMFLANMSHELRTPLNAVLGFSELMTYASNLTRGQRENLAIIGRSGEHLLALISDVLDLSKIEAGKVELMAEVFDLHGILQGLEEMFRLRAAQRDLRIRFEIALNVPRYIRADVGKLRQVLINLLGNAVKFTKQGGVTVRLGKAACFSPSSIYNKRRSMEFTERGGRAMREKPQDQQVESEDQTLKAGEGILRQAQDDKGKGESLVVPNECEESRAFDSAQDGNEDIDCPVEFVTLHFEVQDTGVGIAPEELEKVFDAFTQTESGRKSRQGTGLGLPISREYVRMMGGELTVESEVGKGSCFRFDIQAELPSQAEIDALRVRTASRHVLGLAPGQEAPDGGPYRILIVEDVEASRRLLIQLLQPLGFEVQAVSNGQEGVEVWEAWQPHLIFMDMGMPVLDGHEATRVIRTRTEPKHISPVIVALTASAFEEDREGILAEGCDEFIRKPFREAKIFDVLQQHLGVEFVYADESEKRPSGAKGVPEDFSASVVALPDALQEELMRAARNADIGRLNELIETVRAQDMQLADALDALAYDFSYGQIQDMLEVD